MPYSALCPSHGLPVKTEVAWRCCLFYCTRKNMRPHSSLPPPQQLVPVCPSEPWWNCVAGGRKISVVQLVQNDITQHWSVWQPMLLEVMGFFFLWRAVEKISYSDRKINKWRKHIMRFPWNYISSSPHFSCSCGLRYPNFCCLMCTRKRICFLCDFKWLLGIFQVNLNERNCSASVCGDGKGVIIGGVIQLSTFPTDDGGRLTHVLFLERNYI